MKKLIETTQEHSIVCDNPNCSFTVPYSEEEEAQISSYIYKPCPECGDSLLTVEDYIQHLKIKKAIAFINKWFSWITIFMSKKSKETAQEVEVHVHNGINITKRK